MEQVLPPAAGNDPSRWSYTRQRSRQSRFHRLAQKPSSRSCDARQRVGVRVAFFVVVDFDRTIAELRACGPALQDYDLPRIGTQDGVLVASNAGRRALFRDPDGNVFGLFEQPFLTGPEVDQLARVEGGRNG
jgi:catechol 2,3-dioxygenase-like lactoylglutathione lyase family enzyme